MLKPLAGNFTFVLFTAGIVSARLLAIPVMAGSSGYAVAGADEITRVDVSADGGRSWHVATIEAHGGGRWAWRFWHAVLPLAPGPHELVVRAWDAADRTQPETPGETWNFKGYLSTAWHRVPVTAAPA